MMDEILASTQLAVTALFGRNKATAGPPFPASYPSGATISPWCLLSPIMASFCGVLARTKFTLGQTRKMDVWYIRDKISADACNYLIRHTSFTASIMALIASITLLAMLSTPLIMQTL